MLEHRDKIFKNLKASSVEDYRFIQAEFNKGDVSSNDKFQKRYRRFYGLNIAHLVDKFYEVYFKTLDKLRNEPEIDVFDVLSEIGNDSIQKKEEKRCLEINKEAIPSIQFSFCTKLLHTLNNNCPIYDSEVAKLFNFIRPASELKHKRLEEYDYQYSILEATYNHILQKGTLQELIDRFNNTYSGTKISDGKILDFILWQAGKLKSKAEIEVISN